MNKEEECLYLQNIEEFVFEENKIITYQWLCKTLDIHVNLAKQLLHTYATQDSTIDKISTTYLLAGVPTNGIGYHVAVVKDVNVSNEKLAFQTVTSEHVYSVQKKNALNDLNVLYNVDISDDHKNNNYKRLSSINYEAVERDPAVIATLRAAALPVPSKQPIASLKKPQSKPVIKSPKKQASPKKLASPQKQISPKKTTNAETEKPKGNDKPTVASMFANAANKKTTASNNTKSVKDTNPKSKGISAFFNKAPQKPKEYINRSEKIEQAKMEVESQISPKLQNKDNSSDTKIEGKSPKKEEIKIDKSEKKVDSPKVTKEKSKKLQTKEKESKGKKRMKKLDDKDKVVKKRKRIIAMSDSESDSDEDDSNMDVVRETTPPPQPTVINEESEDEEVIQCTPQPTSKRQRRRRLVDRSYLDDEGFMCTSKEYVVESCSDEEEETKEVSKNEETKDVSKNEEAKDVSKNEEAKEVSKNEEAKVPVKDKSETKTVKKPSPKSKRSKKASPQKTKQTNLMSFFGKKP